MLDSKSTGLSNVSGEQPRFVPTLVFLGVVSTAVGSLGAPLLETVVRVDHVSVGASQWTLTTSLLVGAVVTPVLGRIGQSCRRKPVIVAVTVVVLLGCILAALPTGFAGLLVGRGLQGVGLALVPLSVAAARDALPAHRAGPVAALLGVTTAVGIGAGYPVVGVITDLVGMPAAFWSGAAVTAIALVLATRYVPESSGPTNRRFDVSGAVTLAMGTAALLIVLSEGGTWGWLTWRTAAAASTSLMLLTVWAWAELSSPEPLVDLRVMRHRSVMAANGMVFLVGVGIYPLLSLVVRLIQAPRSTGYGFGGSVVVAGTMLIPFSAASFAASRVWTRLLRSVLPEVVVALSTGVLVLAMTVFLVDRSSYGAIIVTMSLAGAGVGGVFAANPLQILTAVPKDETGSAMSVYQVVRSVGFSIGSALSATLLVGSMPTRGGLPTSGGYSTASIVSMAVLLVATGTAVWLALLAAGESARRTGQAAS
jgi:predicted MFS family arabinose efflux permease